MTLKDQLLRTQDGSFTVDDGRMLVETSDGPRHFGHAHFWERALSRGRFIRTAAGATAALLGSSLWTPALVAAPGKEDMPRPIPGGIRVPGIGFFHVFLPVPGAEPSTITDFNGSVGVAQIQGRGTGKDPERETRRLLFDVDMRFMKGLFVGLDGERHRGTFAFI